jgi:type IV pilus assembly protein PilX
MLTPELSQHRFPKQVPFAQAQRGVVLIIALILLVIISLLAITSLRNVGSSEMVAGNVRTTELATQAADIALRHCESSAIKITKLIADPSDSSAQATYATTFLPANVLRANTAVQWQSTPNWDTSTTAAFEIPSSLVGGTTTFKRPPECMVESLTGVTPSGPPASFIITARGFGPEVAAVDASHTRPVGTVVWLQSTIEIQ